MMMWLLEIETQKDFEDQVVEWRARTANNGFDDFVSFNKMVTEIGPPKTGF